MSEEIFLEDIIAFTPSARREIREQIDAQIEEYLARGGEIREFPLREIDYDELRKTLGYDYQNMFGKDWLRNSV